MPDRTRSPSAADATDSAELDPRLDNVLFDVWLVSRATTALLDEALRGSGLDSDEFAVYSVLASTEHMTPTELARWMSAPPTTVSSYVKRFEQRGHIVRTPNPDDGRSYRLSLTPAGRRAASHRRGALPARPGYRPGPHRRRGVGHPSTPARPAPPCRSNHPSPAAAV